MKWKLLFTEEAIPSDFDLIDKSYDFDMDDDSRTVKKMKSKYIYLQARCDSEGNPNLIKILKSEQDKWFQLLYVNGYENAIVWNSQLRTTLKMPWLARLAKPTQPNHWVVDKPCLPSGFATKKSVICLTVYCPIWDFVSYDIYNYIKNVQKLHTTIGFLYNVLSQFICDCSRSEHTEDVRSLCELASSLRYML